jgi:hypothetical protein
LISPINDVITFKVNEPSIFTSATFKFYYSLDEGVTIKTFQATKILNKYVNDVFDLKFDTKTIFDFKSNEVKESINGETGFKIPSKSFGYYEILLDIAHNNNSRKYMFVNSFNFLNEKEFTIFIKQTLIDSLKNFERIKF